MILLISSALKPSLLVFRSNKEHEIVKQHSFRKGRIRLFNSVYTHAHYIGDIQNKLQEISLPFIVFCGYEGT